MAPAPGRARRVLRILARVLLWLSPGALALAALVGGAAFLWLRTDAGNAWLLGQVLARVQPTAGGIEADSLDTDLLHHLTLRGVRVRGPDGAVLIAVDQAEADLDTESLLGRVLPVHRLDVTGVRVDLPDPGVFGTMWPGDPSAPAEPWGGLPFDLEVEQAHVAGAVVVQGYAVDALQLDAAVTIRGHHVDWSGLTGSGSTVAGPLTLAGAGAWEPGRLIVQGTTLAVGDEHVNRVQIDGALSGDALAISLPEVHFDKEGLVPLIPALASLPLRAPVDVVGRLEGTLAAPEVEVTVTTAGGPLTVSGRVEPASRRWSASVDTPGFSTEPVFEGLEPATLSGHVDAAGSGWTWPDALTADGNVDAQLVARGETVSATGPVHVEAGRITLTRVEARTAWARARVSGEVDVPGQGAQVEVHDGSVGLAHFGVAGHAGFTGSVDASWAGPVTARARGHVAGTRIGAGGATVGVVSGTLDAGWDGHDPFGTVDLAVEDVHAADRHAATGHVHADLGPTVTFTLALDEPDRPIADLAGRYTLAERVLALDRGRVELAPGLLAETVGAPTLTFVPGGVRDVDAVLAVQDARLTVRGGVSSHGRDTLLVDVEALDLSLLERVKPGPFAGWVGVASGHLGLVGTLDAPQVEGVVQLSGFGIPGQVAGLEAEVVVTGDGRSVIVDATVGSATRPMLVAFGRIPVEMGRFGVRLAEAGAIDARLTLPAADVAEWRSLLAGRALPDGRLSAELVAKGTVAAPKLTLTASADLPLSAGGPTTRVWLDAALLDGRVTTRAVLNQGFQSRLDVNLHGQLDVPMIKAWLTGQTGRPEPAAVTSGFGGEVVLKRLPLATVRRFVAVPGDVDGAFEGRFDLSGKPWAPRLRGGLDVVGARVGRLDVSSAHLELVPAGAGYLVQSRVGFAAAEGASSSTVCPGGEGGAAGTIEVSGFVPLGEDFDLDRGQLDLTVAGTGLPLAVAEGFSGSLLDTGGCFVLAGAIRGPIRAPELALGFTLEHGASTVPALGIRVDNIHIAGRFQEQGLYIDSASARTATGRTELNSGAGVVEAKGKVSFDQWAPKEIDLSAELDGAWLSATADRRARVSGSLRLKGTGEVVDLTGKLTLDEGFLRLSERFFADERTTALHPDIEIVRPGAVAPVGVVAAGAGPPITVRPRLKLDLARNLSVSVAMPLQGAYGDLARALSTVTVDAEVDGKLDVNQDSGALRVTGDLTTTRGSASVIGRPFDVSEGTVAFTGADFRQPILDLHATHHADCGDIQVAIGGLPGAPTLDFTSDELADRDAVLRALILGTCEDTAASSGQDDTLNQTLGLLTEVLRNQATSAGPALVPIVRIEKLEYESSGTARIGMALGRNVFLTTEYNPSPATVDENQFTVRLEVSTRLRLFIGLETGDRGASSISVYRKLRF